MKSQEKSFEKNNIYLYVDKQGTRYCINELFVCNRKPEKRKKGEEMKKTKEKKPSNITVSDIALVFSIITLVLVIISNFVLE